MPMDRLAGHWLFTHPVMCPPFQFAINKQNYEGNCGGRGGRCQGKVMDDYCLSISSELADDDDNSHPVELDSNIYLSLLAIIYEK